MNNKIRINFGINGDIIQTIEIINGETRDNFFRKLAVHEYLTSLFSGEVLDITDGLKVVGKIVDSNVGDSTEYSDWKLLEDET